MGEVFPGNSIDRWSFLKQSGGALHLAGGYGQLHYRGIYLAPGHSPLAQVVEIAKAT